MHDSVRYLFSEFGVDHSSPYAGQRRGGDYWKIRLALGGAAVNLIILAMFTALFSVTLNSLYEEQRRGHFVSHLAIDTKSLKLPSCPADKTAVGISHLPCLMKNGDYVTSSGPLGPWNCTGDAHAPDRRCPAHGDGKEIVVPEHGVYLVVAQIVLVDSLSTPANLVLSVNNKVRRACAINSTSSSRGSGCSVSMLEELRKGDRLTVGLPDAYRHISPHNTLTYVDLARLGRLGERLSNNYL
ncbi:hypothetical protein BOX15_Mlig023812g1 [Macrostomum lignano]|uniref:Hemagglutinin glycoprotein n=2 Tax=Macrostomum lignano TaxID=282301 RepID=A0A1I8G1C2_9PLAT|nr:hypothetical protein BOX15_Mlig023812g1 [Macrostomum lignano]